MFFFILSDHAGCLFISSEAPVMAERSIFAIEGGETGHELSNTCLTSDVCCFLSFDSTYQFKGAINHLPSIHEK